MNEKHKLAFYDIFFRAEAFSVLDNGAAIGVGIDEVGFVNQRTFDYFSIGSSLVGNKLERHLFAQVADKSAALHCFVVGMLP